MNIQQEIGSHVRNIQFSLILVCITVIYFSVFTHTSPEEKTHDLEILDDISRYPSLGMGGSGVRNYLSLHSRRELLAIWRQHTGKNQSFENISYSDDYFNQFNEILVGDPLGAGFEPSVSQLAQWWKDLPTVTFQIPDINRGASAEQTKGRIAFYFKEVVKNNKEVFALYGVYEDEGFRVEDARFQSVIEATINEHKSGFQIIFKSTDDKSLSFLAPKKSINFSFRDVICLENKLYCSDELLDNFPSLKSDLTNKYNIFVHKAVNELKIKYTQNHNVVELFGLKINALSVDVWGPSVILLIQFYMLVHIRAWRRIGNAGVDGSVWIGAYDDLLAFVIEAVLMLLPFYAIATMTNLEYQDYMCVVSLTLGFVSTKFYHQALCIMESNSYFHRVSVYALPLLIPLLAATLIIVNAFSVPSGHDSQETVLLLLAINILLVFAVFSKRVLTVIQQRGISITNSFLWRKTFVILAAITCLMIVVIAESTLVKALMILIFIQLYAILDNTTAHPEDG